MHKHSKPDLAKLHTWSAEAAGPFEPVRPIVERGPESDLNAITYEVAVFKLDVPDATPPDVADAVVCEFVRGLGPALSRGYEFELLYPHHPVRVRPDKA